MKAKFNGKEYRVSEIIDGGERWFEIEEIKEVKEQPKQPQRKFKAGDKVRIKDGLSSKNYPSGGPHFADGMDEFIGMNLTVAGHTEWGSVFFNEDEMEYIFDEEWLEPWSDEKEELKEGDLAIFWDYYPWCARIAAFSKKEYGSYSDDSGLDWRHAVKFECTKEQRAQYEKVRKGEITL